MTGRAVLAVAALALAGAAAVPAPAAGPAAAPRVEQLVVFRDGGARVRAPGTSRTSIKIGKRACAVPRATPLAALVRSRVRPLRVRDFSHSCDASSLLVTTIGPGRNRGTNGWVYKVGHRQGTAGAASPTGPFGSGRLRPASRITWFYCVFRGGGCQRTLGLRATHEGGGRVALRVRAYDDEGHGSPAGGALVTAGAFTATTDARGRATLVLPPGTHSVVASKRGLIRSFGEAVTVE